MEWRACCVGNRDIASPLTQRIHALAQTPPAFADRFADRVDDSAATLAHSVHTIVEQSLGDGFTNV